MFRTIRKSGVGKTPLSEIKGNFSPRLENDPRFLRRIEQARNNLHAGRGIKLEDVEAE